jgi:putative two-component system response regulator
LPASSGRPHERWDGERYPDGLAGEDIPRGARIIIICDAFDSIRSERPYSTRRGQRRALAELRRGAGSHFDPHLVEVFCSVVDQVERDERWRAEGAPMTALS